MNDLQKYLFDVRGWMLIPGLLDDGQVRAIRDHIYAGGDAYSGPAAELLDHPVVVDILYDLLDSRIEGSRGEDHYPFRCENSFVTIRKGGFKDAFTGVPHNVGRANVLAYQCERGRIYSGLTRVVWELNPVGKKDGGTLFLSGSHKANFELPPEIKVPENEHMESYECPAGSLFIFAESLLHAAAPWTNYETDRAAIFYAYNSVMSQYHKLTGKSSLQQSIETMPRARQSLFRGVYYHDFEKVPGVLSTNDYYAEDNRAL